MKWKLLALGFLGLIIGFTTIALTAHVSSPKSRENAAVAVMQRGSPPRVLMVFIDSLSREVATDPARMPTLVRLAREGASFDVDPCRDQLTYLCLRAAFTGHDDSSLLSVSDNFRPDHDAPKGTLLSALAEKHTRISVIGSHDFHPYRRDLVAEHDLAKKQETPAQVLATLQAARSDDATLQIVSLASGDMAAHAHGVASHEYREAFARLDDVVRALAEASSPDTHLVVFGDHGHDERGRHLPGTSARTWAVYHGPAFRSGIVSHLGITDHRTLLGVLLGVSTEPSYGGAPLASLFEPQWVKEHLPAGLPKLERVTAASPQPSNHWIGPAVIGMLAALAACLWSLRSHRQTLYVALAWLASVLAALIGLGYDRIRCLVHDHGDSPERCLSLLAPIIVGGLVAVVIRRTQSDRHRFEWIPTAAMTTVVTTFLLMLPTSYYYGSRRAVVLAATLAVVTVFIHYLRSCPRSQRLPTALALAFVVTVLLSLYPVRQLGPETGGASTWALDARLYTVVPWLPLVASKLVLYWLVIVPRAPQRPLDTAAATGLLSACVLVELASAHLPREAYGLLLAVLLVGAGFARHQLPSSLTACVLLLFEHLYGADRAHIAAMEMLMAGTAAALFAWQSLKLPVAARRVLDALTVAVAVYLMLWPTVGFHLAGMDFSYMFQWVPEEKYDKWWILIGGGLIIKLALPIVLLLVVAREQVSDPKTRTLVVSVLVAKVVLLSILIGAFSVGHAMGSEQAMAMLAELALVMFAMCCAFAALPWSRAAAVLAR